ncbi:MAG TPA: YceI family protein [Ilumatobacteraceae bacterium]|nr:YceI family protein [Ilumatobacteraceae bacterium]
MDIPLDPPQPPSPRRRRPVRWIAGGLVVLAALAGLGIWWFFKDDPPAEPELATAVEQIDDGAASSETTDQAVTTEAAAEPVTTEAAAEPTTPVAGTAVAPPTGVAGTWAVDTSIGEFSFEDSTGTFVGFRVQEELTGIGSTTAVGRTPEVGGTMTIDGTTVTAVSIEANMDAITTNDRRRDGNALRALDTDEFPVATFVLTQPIELGDAAATGEPVRVTAVGDLTIHGTTLPVEIPLDAQLVDDVVVVVGSIEIVFADYGVSVPDAPIVVSAEDHGIIELQLFFTR